MKCRQCGREFTRLPPRSRRVSCSAECEALLQKERQRRYRTSTKGKETGRRYSKSENARATKRRNARRYYQTKKGQDVFRRARRRWASSEKGRMWRKEWYPRYLTRDEVRARRTENQRRYAKTAKGRATAVRARKTIEAKAYYQERRRREGSRSYKELRREMIREAGCCKVCGSKDRLTLDHKVPLSKGGKHVRANLQVLCHSCNSRKNDRIEETS